MDHELKCKQNYTVLAKNIKKSLALDLCKEFLDLTPKKPSMKENYKLYYIKILKN